MNLNMTPSIGEITLDKEWDSRLISNLKPTNQNYKQDLIEWLETKHFRVNTDSLYMDTATNSMGLMETNHPPVEFSIPTKRLIAQSTELTNQYNFSKRVISWYYVRDSKHTLIKNSKEALYLIQEGYYKFEANVNQKQKMVDRIKEILLYGVRNIQGPMPPSEYIRNITSINQDIPIEYDPTNNCITISLLEKYSREYLSTNVLRTLKELPNYVDKFRKASKNSPYPWTNPKHYNLLMQSPVTVVNKAMISLMDKDSTSYKSRPRTQEIHAAYPVFCSSVEDHKKILTAVSLLWNNNRGYNGTSASLWSLQKITGKCRASEPHSFFNLMLTFGLCPYIYNKNADRPEVNTFNVVRFKPIKWNKPEYLQKTYIFREEMDVKAYVLMLYLQLGIINEQEYTAFETHFGLNTDENGNPFNDNVLCVPLCKPHFSYALSGIEN